MDDGPRSILIAVILILCGGFFAGSETAFSFCNQVRMRTLAEDGNRRARRLVRILDDFDGTIVTLLIAINILYILSASLTTMAAVRLWGSAGSVLSTVLTTLGVFLFAETIPKNFARANSDAYALFAALPISVFKILFSPLTLLLSKLGESVKKALPPKPEVPDVTEDEFEEMVESVQNEDELEPVEKEIIKSTIHFGDILAGSVMTKKEEIVAVSDDMSAEALKDLLIDEKYSRFPVYHGDVNSITGVLRANQVLSKLMNGTFTGIQDVITRPYIIRPDVPVSKVFEGMSGRHTHMAIVAENGVTEGLVTMEDILEEIVGEIYDEDDGESGGEAGC